MVSIGVASNVMPPHAYAVACASWMRLYRRIGLHAKLYMVRNVSRSMCQLRLKRSSSRQTSGLNPMGLRHLDFGKRRPMAGAHDHVVIISPWQSICMGSEVTPEPRVLAGQVVASHLSLACSCFANHFTRYLGIVLMYSSTQD